MKKVFGILALSAVATMLWANVDLRTNIQDVYYRGTCEEAGSITMSVNGNDFNEASTQAPIYIRIRLNHQAVLCQTLVFDDDDCTDRIYLAMRLEDGNPSNTIAANDESVNIERWVAGEDQIWLRVQTSSATWIQQVAGGLVPPSLSNGRVAWTFGTTARSSVDQNESRFLADRANAPANWRGDDQHAVSTLVCVDLSGSNLAYLNDPNASDDDSILKFDTISFKYDDRDEPSIFENPATPPSNLIPQFGVNFSGDDSIARGYEKFCSGAIVEIDKNYRPVTGLCIWRAGQNAGTDGLVCMEHEVLVTVDCDGWFGDESQWTYDADWDCPGCDDGGDPLVGYVNQAGVFLWKANDGYWGFNHWTVNNTAATIASREIGNAWGYTIYTGDNRNYFTDDDIEFAGSQDILIGANNRGGYYLADGVRVMWFGNPMYNYGSAGPKTLQLTAEVCQWYLDPEGPVELDVVIVSNNYAKAQDDDEFCGLDQFAHCEPSLQYIEDTWYFGDFVNCMGAPVTIFFPYMPRLVDTDYWAGVALVNQGGMDFEAGYLTGSIYEADGNHWMVDFPALPQQTMQTWLIQDGANGPGFYGTSMDPLTEGMFLQPTTAGTDLAFGDVRMNMFVTGGFETLYNDDIYLGDLDGYLLIGLGTSIDGAYLPRNYDNDIPGQNADLPLRRSKAGVTLFDMEALRQIAVSLK